MQHRVTLLDGNFYVHVWAKAPTTGVKVDARSVHFNWLLMIPLLVASRGLTRGVPGPRRTALAVLALVSLHVGFLVAVTEYRMLRHEDIHPRLAFVLNFLSQFYYAVGRIGLPVLIWMPIGLSGLLGGQSSCLGGRSSCRARGAVDEG